MKIQLAAFLMMVPLLATSFSVDAKVRCNLRDCKKIGGMEVTLRTYDALREGSKLNILKIRRKVAKARARVELSNYYYENGMQVHDDHTTKTGRSAKKVKLVHWHMPFQGGGYITANWGCDPAFERCETEISAESAPGTRWVGFDGKWDGVCAVARVTINGQTDTVYSSTGNIPILSPCYYR